VGAPAGILIVLWTRLAQADSCSTRRPSFVFLIHHPVTREYIVWDLGIRRDVKQHFPDPSLDKFEAHFEEEVTDSLQRVNVSPDQVKKVLISRESPCPSI